MSTATQTAINNATVGLLDDRGNYNASVNTFPATGGSGTAGAVLKGDLWTVSVAGTLGGVAVTAGDVVRSLIDTPAQVASNWAISENNIGYVAENQANKDNTTTLGTSTTLYPTQNAVKVYADTGLATKQASDAGLTALSALTGAGYVKETATDTFALVTTIPNTDITGLGTLSTQSGTFTAIPQANVVNLVSDLALKAPLASPTFTGTVGLPAGQVVNGVTLSTVAGSTNFLK